MTRSGFSLHCSLLWTPASAPVITTGLFPHSDIGGQACGCGCEAERGERGMSCGPPTTSRASRDSDCWSVKWKQPHCINSAQSLREQKNCSSYMLCSAVQYGSGHTAALQPTVFRQHKCYVAITFLGEQVLNNLN